MRRQGRRESKAELMARRFDQVLVDRVGRLGAIATRLALGTVFVWFGALKLSGQTPVAELVARAIPWISPLTVMPALGALEACVGVALLTGWGVRTALVIFWVQMLGTLTILFRFPDIAFQNGHVLLLTAEGEFIVKNVILIAAGMVVAGSLGAAMPRRHAS